MRADRQRVAWISGGSGDIGRAIAIRFAQRGVRVAISYYRSREKAEETLRQCCEYGGQHMIAPLSFHSRKQVEDTYRAVVYTLGTPNIVIHAAGKTTVGLFQDYSDDDYNEMFQVHVRGAFYMLQTALPKMIQNRWGRIILVTSIWGETGGAMEVLYSAAKGAQIAMAKALAKEVAASGVTVNAISPGAIQTQMLSNQLTKEEQRDLVEEIPIGRLGTPDEVAQAVDLLCREESSYITGQVIRVNGGWYC